MHLDYPDAMLQLGRILSIPCIDLCEISKELLRQAGDAMSQKWYICLEEGIYDNYPEGLVDNTHLH